MNKRELTNAEMMVMGVIWDNPKQLVLSEIVHIANERYKKDWKPQTVSTYLAHLVEKGYLKMHRNGKIYTYEPLESKDTYTAILLEKLCDWYRECMHPVELVSRLFPEI